MKRAALATESGGGRGLQGETLASRSGCTADSREHGQKQETRAISALQGGEGQGARGDEGVLWSYAAGGFCFWRFTNQPGSKSELGTSPPEAH